MYEYIKSKDVRCYLEKMNYRFTDEEQAVLVYISKEKMEKRHEAWIEISRITSNDKLKSTIDEYINLENMYVEKYQQQTGEYIYKLEIWDEEDREYMNGGSFVDYKLAVKQGRKSGRKFLISRLKLQFKEREWNEDEWDEGEEESILHDKDGSILKCYGLPTLEGDKYINFDFKEVEVPHPYKTGDIVRWIGTDDIGIVHKVGNDNCDFMLVIDMMYGDAEFSHFHIYPGELEYVRNFPKEDRRKELLFIASQVVKGKALLQEFQMACEAYKSGKRLFPYDIEIE